MKKMIPALFLSIAVFAFLPLCAQQNQPETKSRFELINSKLLFNENIKIINLGPNVNSKYVDYAPTVTIDGKTLFFVSNRPGSKISQHNSGYVVNANEYSHDFWAAKKKDILSTDFSDIYNLDAASIGYDGLNTNSNEGAASISADGKKMYFTGCSRPDGFGDCDIYVSYFDGEKWGKPINLGKNVNSKYWDTQPSISPYEKRLYFVSNRPKNNNQPNPVNKGNMDIWYCDWDEEKGEFGPAKNLWEINTPQREFSPFIAPDGVTLFFSSTGYKPNYGGLDFYVTKFDAKSGTWSEPKNLGKPLNTESDDMFLTIPANDNVIYFSSQRKDIDGYMGNLDIYMAYLPESNEKKISEQEQQVISKIYPNPFNKEVTIDFTLDKPGQVKVVIINVYGEEVKILENSSLSPNQYKLVWNAKNNQNADVPSGAYYYTITIESEGKTITETNKVLLVR